jgi:hypothetical protein
VLLLIFNVPCVRVCVLIISDFRQKAPSDKAAPSGHGILLRGQKVPLHHFQVIPVVQPAGRKSGGCLYINEKWEAEAALQHKEARSGQTISAEIITTELVASYNVELSINITYMIKNPHILYSIGRSYFLAVL